jgi:predicted metal-binding membrane protein
MQPVSRTELSPPPLNIQERTIILYGIILVATIAWIYMFYMSWAMDNMHLVDMWMPPKGGTRLWTSWDFFMLFSMWLIMMLAMMSPTAVPMVMMFATVNKNKKRKNQPYAPTFIFLAGYLAAWTLFSILASLIQWPLHEIGLLNPMMNSRSYIFSGAILIIAGLYQWTPLKDRCLRQCRTPLGFIMTSWREGQLGAFIMGLHHGLFCVGCCWALMAILFSVGVMNMLWVILITLFVLFEKIAPISPTFTRGLTGLGLIVWGMYWTSLYPW